MDTAVEQQHFVHSRQDPSANPRSHPTAHGHASWQHGYGPTQAVQPSSLRPVVSGAMPYQAAAYGYPPEAAGLGAGAPQHLYGVPLYAPPYASPPQYLPPPGYFPAGAGYGYGPGWGAMPPWAMGGDGGGAHAAGGHPHMAAPHSSGMAAADGRGGGAGGYDAAHSRMAGEGQMGALPGTSHVAQAMYEQGVRLVPPPTGWTPQGGGAGLVRRGAPHAGAAAHRLHPSRPAGLGHGDSHA